MSANGSWEENRKLILSELSDIKASILAMREAQMSIREDLASLKTKAGIAGAVAGAIAAWFGGLFSGR